jgi:hypothetical protein
MAKLSVPIESARHNSFSTSLRSPQTLILILSLLLVSLSHAQTTGRNKTVDSVVPSGPKLVWKYHTGG